MAQLPIVDWTDVVKAFRMNGWQHDRTRGSHCIMTRPNRPGLLSVPMHKPVKRGTLHKLIRQAGLTTDEFIGFLH